MFGCSIAPFLISTKGVRRDGALKMFVSKCGGVRATVSICHCVRLRGIARHVLDFLASVAFHPSDGGQRKPRCRPDAANDGHWYLFQRAQPRRDFIGQVEFLEHSHCYGGRRWDGHREGERRLHNLRDIGRCEWIFEFECCAGTRLNRDHSRPGFSGAWNDTTVLGHRNL